MRLNIAHKIFAISAFVLVLMVAVAIYSIKLTGNISSDLHGIAHKQLPASMSIARINALILQQGIIFQRQLVSLEDNADQSNLLKEHKKFQALGKKVEQEFNHARTLLTHGARSTRVQQADQQLLDHLNAIEVEYQAFEHAGESLVERYRVIDKGSFESLDEQLNQHQDQLDHEISNFSEKLALLADKSVVHADSDEKRLLLVSILLTSIAVIFAIGFAYFVTKYLVRSVKNLVTGTVAVEAGDYESKVAVTSSDEIGKLTTAFNGMVDGLRMKEQIKDTFGKYMDPRIVANLMESPDFSRSDRREMTVLFIDLKGFTSISEELKPEELVYMINDFFTYMGESIANHDGVVDKYMGDAVMAFWGTPFCGQDQHASLACETALAALDNFERFRKNLHARLGKEHQNLEVDIRIGISTGDMTVGNIGSIASKSYTIMGNSVNFGSRLEGANKAYGTHILISDRTRALIGDQFFAREIDVIRVKGQQESARIHEISKQPFDQPQFTLGLQAYRQQNWPAAEAAFGACDDCVAQAYLQRIELLKHEALPTDWDGVWSFQTK